MEHAQHNFKLIGGAGSSFHILGPDVYAVGTGKNIWKYERYNSKWIKLEKVADELAAAGKKIYALDAKKTLSKFKPKINQWVEMNNIQYEVNPQYPQPHPIGYPQIVHLIEGGDNLFVVVAGGDIYRLKHKILYKVAAPAQEFVSIGNLVLSIVNNQVYSPKVGQFQWELVGSDFKHIIAGVGRVFGIHATNGFIYEWKFNELNKPWIPIGNLASKYVVCQSGLYGITHNRASIIKYKESHMPNIVGGPTPNYNEHWETVAILRVKEIFGCGLGDLPVVIRINEKEQEEVGIIF